MATSSITKTLIIDNKKDCRNFVKAIEKSKKKKPKKAINYSFREVSAEEIKELFKTCDNICSVGECEEIQVPLLGEANCTK